MLRRRLSGEICGLDCGGYGREWRGDGDWGMRQKKRGDERSVCGGDEGGSKTHDVDNGDTLHGKLQGRQRWESRAKRSVPYSAGRERPWGRFGYQHVLHDTAVCTLLYCI